MRYLQLDLLFLSVLCFICLDECLKLPLPVEWVGRQNVQQIYFRVNDNPNSPSSYNRFLGIIWHAETREAFLVEYVAMNSPTARATIRLPSADQGGTYRILTEIEDNIVYFTVFFHNYQLNYGSNRYTQWIWNGQLGFAVRIDTTDTRDQLTVLLRRKYDAREVDLSQLIDASGGRARLRAGEITVTGTLEVPCESSAAAAVRARKRKPQQVPVCRTPTSNTFIDIRQPLEAPLIETQPCSREGVRNQIPIYRSGGSSGPGFTLGTNPDFSRNDCTTKKRPRVDVPHITDPTSTNGWSWWGGLRNLELLPDLTRESYEREAQYSEQREVQKALEKEYQAIDDSIEEKRRQRERETRWENAAIDLQLGQGEPIEQPLQIPGVDDMHKRLEEITAEAGVDQERWNQLYEELLTEIREDQNARNMVQLPAQYNNDEILVDPAWLEEMQEGFRNVLPDPDPGNEFGAATRKPLEDTSLPPYVPPKFFELPPGYKQRFRYRDNPYQPW